MGACQSKIEEFGRLVLFNKLVSHVPDGDYSDRTKPADLRVPPSSTVVCPLVSEPTEPLLGDHQGPV